MKDIEEVKKREYRLPNLTDIVSRNCNNAIPSYLSNVILDNNRNNNKDVSLE